MAPVSQLRDPRYNSNVLLSSFKGKENCHIFIKWKYRARWIELATMISLVVVMVM
jgi:hypothetical protein